VFLLVVACVTVSLDRFENVTDVLVHETAILPCTSPGTMNTVWYYQQYCDHFEHGLYSCSRRTAVTVGNQYQIRINAPDEHSLLINDVTRNMTGLYTCENSERDMVIYTVFLNVICKYNFCFIFGSSVITFLVLFCNMRDIT